MQFSSQDAVTKKRLWQIEKGGFRNITFCLKSTLSSQKSLQTGFYNNSVSLPRLPLKNVARIPMAHSPPSVNHKRVKSQWKTYDTCCSNDHRCYNSYRPTPLNMYPRIPWTVVHLRCIKLHGPHGKWQLPNQTAILFSLRVRSTNSAPFHANLSRLNYASDFHYTKITCFI
jgi:hypothetical protein